MTTYNPDLFISYAHIDNKTGEPDKEEIGWIEQFHEKLEAYVSQHLGSDVRIFRDHELAGNSIFSDEIIDQLAHSAVFVSVLTPRYIRSEWCTREMSEFCRGADQTGGISVDNRIRIFKVVKIPVKSLESLPKVVKDALEYEFYKLENGRPFPLDSSFGENYQIDYNRKVNELAFDIKEMLEKLKSGRQVNGKDEGVAAKPTVYLAECSYDRKRDRDELRCELKRLGYSVLPDKVLDNDNDEEYVAAITPLLEHSKLSIHLIGETGGPVPDGPSHKSLSVLQNEVAAEFSKSDELKRVIWVPEGTTSKQANQQAFIESLHNDAVAQFGADLITGGLEELKASIRSELRKLEKAEPQLDEEPPTVSDRPKLIYVVCVKDDLKDTVPLLKFCRAQGFDVKVPAFEGDAAEIQESHEELLSDCDAVILYYGSGDAPWKRTIDSDLRKIQSIRRGKTLPARFTYLAAPSTDDKEILIVTEPDLINGLGEFADSMMSAFVSAMKPVGGIQ